MIMRRRCRHWWLKRIIEVLFKTFFCLGANLKSVCFSSPAILPNCQHVYEQSSSQDGLKQDTKLLPLHSPQLAALNAYKLQPGKGYRALSCFYSLDYPLLSDMSCITFRWGNFLLSLLRVSFFFSFFCIVKNGQ